MKQIYDFAAKWAKKFKSSETNYIELVDHYLGDDCSALGFDMICQNMPLTSKRLK